jgi:hypothetical protein
MPDRREVYADLMGAPGEGRGLQERRAHEPLPDHERGLRLLPSVLTHDHAGPAAAQGRVHGEPVVLHVPPHEREVPAFDLVTRQHRREQLVRLVILGDHEQPRGPGVETMHDAPPLRSGHR